jgi:hypothetical protein
MNFQVFRRWKMLISFFFLPLLVSLACMTMTGDTPAGPEPTQEAREVDVVLGPGSFDLTDTQVGLDKLSTYKATLTISFDGTKDGQPYQWSSTYEALYAKEPLARQVTILQTGDTSEEPELPALMAEKDGAAYEIGANGSCTASVFDSQNPLMGLLAPAGLLTGVFGAEEAGQETVNGVATAHYTFDERALVQNGRNKSTGEMWVASEGGFIVRYLVTTKGNADYFGGGIEGTLTRDYQLTEVNQPLTIELPVNCPPGLVDAPLLSDASIVVNLPGLLAYDTGTSVLEARAFYEQELPKLGWGPPTYQLPEGMSQEEYDRLMQDMQQLEQLGLTQPTPTPNPSEAFLVFQQGDQLLYLLITLETSGTRVQITLNRSVE